MYLTGHPLEDYVELLDSLNVASIPALEEMEEGKEVTVAGMAAACRTIITRNGKHMAFLTLEDQFTTLEVIIFEEVLTQSRELLAGEAPLLVTGRLEFATQGEPKMRAETIAKLEVPNSSHKLYLKIEGDTDSDCINRVLYVLDQYPGDVPVYMFFAATKALRLMDKFPVNPDRRLLVQLEDMLGKDCVVLKNTQRQAAE